jgi:Tfp pilus assembly protein FimT
MANCTGGTNWNRGWIVFSDLNGDYSVSNANERVLKTQAAFTGLNPDTFNSPVAAVRFNREGFATTAAGFVATTLTLTESTNSNAYTRCLQLSPTGMLTAMSHVSNPTGC